MAYTICAHLTEITGWQQEKACLKSMNESTSYQCLDSTPLQGDIHKRFSKNVSLIPSKKMKYNLITRNGFAAHPTSWSCFSLPFPTKHEAVVATTHGSALASSRLNRTPRPSIWVPQTSHTREGFLNKKG